MSKLAVIIPVYRNKLSTLELVSYQSIIGSLIKYDIYLVAPDGLKLTGILNKNIQVISFDRRYFESVQTYNKLMLSASFYEAFSKYNHILISQLDSYIINGSKLEEFLREDIDYIGAPWIYRIYKITGIEEYIPFYHKRSAMSIIKYFTAKPYLVGNGGLSLRKVETFRRVASEYANDINSCLEMIESESEEDQPLAINEDVIWSIVCPVLTAGSLKVARFRDALKFSWDSRPDVCNRFTFGRLPFGCHAWDKNLEFWRNKIPDIARHLEN